jgi:ribosomal protein L44E
MEKEEWLLCPVCKNKTRIKMLWETVLINFPLFCPKCKQETMVNVQQLKLSIVEKAKN